MRVLVAARGDAALRVIRACRDAGLGVVAIHTDVDAGALHARLADAAVRVGSYLDADGIVAAAVGAQCAAIHPGIGFLSESAVFAEAAAAAGLRFVGPSADCLRLFGDKTAARRFVEGARCGPVVPGSEAALSTAREAEALVQRMGGLPVVLKAAHGGGGKGIKIVREEGELADAFERAQSEAAAAFGDGAIFVEKYIPRARHVEVQVFGDQSGGVVHLWDRECSLQRRHQKVVEVAPATAAGIPEALSAELCARAVAIMRAAHYQGAGTVEFLVADEKDGAAYFMECNPRLQVEHGVTEQVLRVDLVVAQLRAALDGALVGDLFPAPGDMRPSGVCLQLRVVAAEPGPILALTAPSGPGVRFEPVYHAGMTVPAAYDALVAKLLVEGPTLAVACARARRALAETAVVGIATSLPLLRHLVASGVVAGGQYTTGLLDQLPEDAHGSKADTVTAVLRAAAERDPGTEVETPIGRAVPLSRSAESATFAIESMASPVVVALEAHGRGSDRAAEAAAGAPVVSPLSGQVVAMPAQVGDRVSAKDPVAVVALMKLEHEVLAECSGVVTFVGPKAGDAVRAGALLVKIEGESAEGAGISAMRRVETVVGHLSAQEMRNRAHWMKRLKELEERRRLSLEMGGARSVARQKKAGKLTCRERIAELVDAGTFREVGGTAGKGEYDDESGALVGLTAANFVFGIAEILARPAVIAADDFTSRGGHADAGLFRKSYYAEQLAVEHRIPLVRLIDGSSGGGSVKLILDAGFSYVPPLPGYDTMCAALSVVPIATVVAGPAVGLGAARAVTAHFSVMVEEIGQVFVAGPPVVLHATGEKVSKNELGGVAIHAANGTVDNVAPSESAAFEQVRRFLSYLPASAHECPPCSAPVEPAGDPEELLGIVPIDRSQGYDMRRILALVCDGGSVFEIGASYGRSAVTCLARVGGRPVAVLASDVRSSGGTATALSSEKTRRLVDLANVFGLPIVSFVDLKGFLVGKEAEQTSVIRKGASLIASLYASTVPWFTVVVRSVFGVAGAALVSRRDMDVRIAWPSGVWGSLPLEGGVEAAFKRQLGNDPDALAEMKRKLEALQDPFRTAEHFGIEDIVDPRATRHEVCKWLQLVWKRVEGRGKEAGAGFRP